MKSSKKQKYKREKERGSYMRDRVFGDFSNPTLEQELWIMSNWNSKDDVKCPITSQY
jgi:hypothetical protein